LLHFGLERAEANKAHFGEKLKSILDTSFEGLPYVIGATTDSEYQQYIANDPAYDRRFKVINIAPLNKTQVLLTLREMIRRQYPAVCISEQFLEDVYESSQKLLEEAGELNKLQQPEISKRILTTAISRIAMEEQRNPSEEILKEKKINLTNFQSLYVTSLNDRSMLLNIQIQIENLKKEIEELEDKVQYEKESIRNYHALSEKIAWYNEKLIVLAGKIEVLTQKQDRSCNREKLDRCKTKFTLIFEYWIPYLEKIRKEMRKHLKLPILNQDLLQQLNNEYIKDLKTAKTTATQSRE
jgi:ATP-dependent Clp protease ATP-binding subunit ClpA